MWNIYPEQRTHTICKTAEEFLEHLTSPSKYIGIDQSSKNQQNMRLIFRGVANSTHRLVPTALRTKEEHKPSYESLWSISESIKGGSISSEDREKEISQRLAELNVAKFFYQYCERALLNHKKIDNDTLTDRGELHQTLHQFKSTEKINFHEPPRFASLHLPISESPQLLLLLIQLGYSANRIYHGYSGAADAVKEHAQLFNYLQ